LEAVLRLAKEGNVRPFRQCDHLYTRFSHLSLSLYAAKSTRWVPPQHGAGLKRSSVGAQRARVPRRSRFARRSHFGFALPPGVLLAL
jgi:hypothetical protein